MHRNIKVFYDFLRRMINVKAKLNYQFLYTVICNKDAFFIVFRINVFVRTVNKSVFNVLY